MALPSEFRFRPVPGVDYGRSENVEQRCVLDVDPDNPAVVVATVTVVLKEPRVLIGSYVARSETPEGLRDAIAAEAKRFRDDFEARVRATGGVRLAPDPLAVQ